jgi:hypothetical protein
MRPATGLLFIPQVIGIISPGTNSSFVYQSSLEILPAKSSSSKAGGHGKGNYEFCIQNISFILARFFNVP